MNGISTTCRQHPMLMIGSVVALIVSIGSTVGWAISYGRLTSAVEQATIDNNRDRLEMHGIRERTQLIQIEQSGRSAQLAGIAEDIKEIKFRLNALVDPFAGGKREPGGR